MIQPSNGSSSSINKWSEKINQAVQISEVNQRIVQLGNIVNEIKNHIAPEMLQFENKNTELKNLMNEPQNKSNISRIQVLYSDITELNRKLMDDESSILKANTEIHKALTSKTAREDSTQLRSPIQIMDDYTGKPRSAQKNNTEVKQAPKIVVEPSADEFKKDREIFLLNLSSTLNLFKEKIEKTKPLPVGIYRESGSKNLRDSFAKLLENGNVDNLNKLLAAQDKGNLALAGDELKQLADFTQVCIRHIKANPQLFESDEAKQELQTTLKPLIESLVTIVRRFPETKMGWPNIQTCILLTMNPVFKQYGLWDQLDSEMKSLAQKS